MPENRAGKSKAFRSGLREQKTRKEFAGRKRVNPSRTNGFPAGEDWLSQ